MAFNARTKDLKSNVYSPTKPASEAAIRKQIDDSIQEVFDNITTPLVSNADGSSGADNIGATPLSGGTANTVQGILEEIKTGDTNTNVKLTGNQTIAGIKTFSSSPIVPVATTSTQAPQKSQVDTVQTNLNTHKTSSDHDSRYYTETELNTGQLDNRYYTETETNSLLLANQTGNHLGTWQGFSPTQTDPGIQAVVDQLVEDVNSPETISTSLTLLEQLKTFLDSFASPSDFRIGGASLYQAVTNGNFSGGTTGWSGQFCSISTTSNVLKSTADGSVSTARIYGSGVNKNLLASNKYFVYAKLRVTNSDCLTLAIQVADITGSAQAIQTISSPVINTYYELKGIVTISTVTKNLLMIHNYKDATTANGKVMEVDGNVGVFAIPLTGTPYESYTSDQMNALVGEYFEGLKGAESFEVGSREKNLFDKQTRTRNFTLNSSGVEVASTTDFTSKFMRVKASTTYYLSGKTAAKFYALYDKNKNFISATSITNAQIVTTSTTDYIKFSALETNADTAILGQSATALPYEPYQGSLATVNAKRHKLPNLVEDSLELVDGRWKYYKRTKEYVLQSADITFAAAAVNVKIYYITLTGLSPTPNSGLPSGKVIFPNLTEIIAAEADNVSQIGNFYTVNDNKLRYVGSFTSTLGDIQAALVNTPIVYQLETPLIIEEKDFNAYGISVEGSLSSNLDYTEYFVNDYDLFTEPTIDYAGNLPEAVSELKNSVDGIRLAVDGKASKVSEPLIVPTLVNSFVNGGGVGYYKDDLNRVHLQGKLTTGASGASPFTLTTGYRPSVALSFAINSNNAFGRCDIATTGVITVTGNVASYWLDGISFKAV